MFTAEVHAVLMKAGVCEVWEVEVCSPPSVFEVAALDPADCGHWSPLSLILLNCPERNPPTPPQMFVHPSCASQELCLFQSLSFYFYFSPTVVAHGFHLFHLAPHNLSCWWSSSCLTRTDGQFGVTFSIKWKSWDCRNGRMKILSRTEMGKKWKNSEVYFVPTDNFMLGQSANICVIHI